MDVNHQDKTGSKLIASEYQEKLRHIQKKPFAQRMGFADKTLWDFIQLLVIPLALLGIGSLFSYQQNQTSLQSSQKQHNTDLQIAATRYANDQQLAADQQRETTLKTCLDDIKDLLLNKSLRASKPQDEVRVVARGEVLAALRQLDRVRKRLLMQFLSEAGLITSSSNDAIINLSDADLSDTYLRGVLLDVADLGFANLSKADLRGAYMSGADLVFANLSGADLSDADLNGVRGVSQEQLAKAFSLQGATMPDGSKHP